MNSDGAQDRLSEEARATASALLEWLGSRVDQAAAPGGTGARPAQSPGPCTWCPVCALVAALRGEQPELTARLAEQASGLMLLLRAMVQAHEQGGHGHGGPEHHGHPAAHGFGPLGSPFGDDLGATGTTWPPPGARPAGWPPEWDAPAAHVHTTTSEPVPDDDPLDEVIEDLEGPAVDTDDDPAADDDPRRSAAGRPPSRPGRTPRPGPRRAPARTTSPRTAARRPSPRAASMPAPEGEAPPPGPGGRSAVAEPTTSDAAPDEGPGPARRSSPPSGTARPGPRAAPRPTPPERPVPQSAAPPPTTHTEAGRNRPPRSASGSPPRSSVQHISVNRRAGDDA